jgi:hypothetical protein
MRREDWPERLAAVIEAAQQRPFAWGRHDCCLFAADVVLELTGQDFAAPFRGRYATALGSKRALSRYGQGTIARTVETLLGEGIAPLAARRGDVVLADTEMGPALGVCVGAVALFAAPKGLAARDLTACRLAWRVD